MKTSKKILVILAAIVWYVGGVMLFRSGYELIRTAISMREVEYWPWIFILMGIILGVIQAMTIFTRACRKNIKRISQLEDPKMWQFFRPTFFLALGIMITTGVLLDHYSKGSYFFMLGVAALDFALTISLLGSSHVFWTQRIPE